MQAPRVLLTWELGLGFGHAVPLSRIGRRLAAAGMEVVAAVPDAALAAPLATAGIALLAAPAWATPPRSTHSATLTDSLAQWGLMDEARVGAALAAWRALLDQVRPDLVVCDYAPLAALAARGRAKVMQTGTGYCLPPAHLDTLPRLHALAPPRHTDANLLAAVNRALDGAGMAPLGRIGALFDGDDVFVSTFPVLDPYADHRARQAEGPLLEAPPRPAAPGARSIFAYLHKEVVDRPDVREALCALGGQLEIYAPRAGEDLLAALRQAGARVHAAPQTLADVLARTGLVLHQGSAGMAAEGLAAGVPQFTLGWQVEQYLNGAALAAAGLARARELFDPAFRLRADDISQFARDADAAFIAEAAGRIHRADLEAADPLDTLTRRCRALLGAGDARADQ